MYGEEGKGREKGAEASLSKTVGYFKGPAGQVGGKQ